ncbi:polysaccharide export protein [Candidatus Koribacter versatilis Ellin345]|uniref:Polysaccharide export protein n=1 Tax=Koribacter versatilis (strain Ellin345) TaxID=204669 RepID=Q1ITG1_KORVE|nr:polysaccharide biosynthesis/export family protein [Candidatus Koribacter versatilis]ABF39839.1 polysaccharide export protein [Candidatus Koribacter versatilis Ellin345]
MKNWLLIGIVALSSWTFAQTDAHPTASSNEFPTRGQHVKTLLIGPGDLLDLNVYDVPELILKVRVDDNGDVSIPLIGQQHWGGLTTVQAADLVTKKLIEGDFVKNPEVSILVDEFATQGISISGEVNQPGIYPLLGPHRLNDAISAAGGLSPRAGRTVTIVHRAHVDEPVIIDLPNSRNMVEANVELEPGDSILVSKAGVVYVMGEVIRPGAFLMENNTRMTILQAVTMAQGPTNIAALGGTRIVRKTPQGVQQFPVALDKITKGVIPDRLLDADDIVVLPKSGVKIAGQITARSAVAAAAALAVYAIR